MAKAPSSAPGSVEALARWFGATATDAIPADAMEQAKLILLDTIGCALTGAQSRVASGTRATVEMMGGKPQATLIGTALKTSVFNAVLANTVFIRSLEINDIMGNDPTDGSKLGGRCLYGVLVAIPRALVDQVGHLR